MFLNIYWLKSVFAFLWLFNVVFLPSLAGAAGTTLNVNVVNSAQMSTTTAFNFTAGGSATFTNTNNTSAFFSFPTNFYSEDLRLQANSYASNFFETNKAALSGKSFIGNTYDFQLFASSTGSQISAVSHPVTIVLSYTDADISGIDESTLSPYRFGESDSAWQLISGGTVDTANNKVTFSTTLFSSFALLGAPPPPASPDPSPSSSGGGGGGGGGGILFAPETKVVFSGRAYPGRKVTLLKDAQIAASVLADPNAAFSISLSGLSGGNYIFGIYSEDSAGRRSSLITYPVRVTSGATIQVGGIFITPTIAVDKSEVKRGENIAIFGQSAPKAEVTVAISSEEEFFGKIIADANGAYLYNFDTTVLAAGQHLTKSKAALGGNISSFGKSAGFIVGTKNVFAQSAKIPKGDLNNDGRVNLVDFSIAAYWYKRSSPPLNSVDLNGDDKVDLIDFSIMAFYWTG